ncbi:hypothetical protein ADL26_13670, partial [Thermoactinomyces vulgaris]
VGDRERLGGGAVLGDDDPAVHFGVLDVHPAAVEPHLGVEVGGGVEVLGEDAVARGRLEGRDAGVERVRAVRLEAHDDAFDQLGRLGGDGELDVGLVGVVAAHVEAVDRVGPRVLEDVVHDAGEDALVDEVSAQLDG